MTEDFEFELLQLPERAEKAKKGTLFAIVKIDCAFSHNVMLPDGTLVPNGVHYARVPEKDLPKIMAQVEPDPDIYAAAIKAHAAQVDSAVKTALTGLPAHLHGQTEADIRASFLGSPVANFARMTMRDLQPFKSVEVLKRGLLAEVDSEAAESEEIQAKRMATAMRSGTSVPSVPLADVQAMIAAEVAKAVAEITARTSGNQNPQNQQRK